MEPNDRIAERLAERGFQVGTLVPLTGDLSARRYFRASLVPLGAAVLALYPEALREECARFSASARLLAEIGVRGPEILAADCAEGWMLVEDLGEWTLGDSQALPREQLDAYFRQAAAIALRIGSLPAAAVAELNPPLDGTLLRRELDLTREAFLEPSALLEGGFSDELTAALDALCDELARPPLVPCHRDLMVRNLMPSGPPPGLAVLDHQGLRLGPARYDLASLLNDTVFPSASLEQELLAQILRDEADRRAYDRAAAQRTLKAIGSYAAAAARGVERHLPLVAPTFERALGYLSRVPETVSVGAELERRWRRSGRHAVLR